MVPVTIPTPGGACFAIYHPAPGPAVLLCPPLGNEALWTARVWRELGQSLSRRGVAMLRPDWPSTGDSADAPQEHDWVTALRDATRGWTSWLADRHDGRVALLGQRFGGLLAIDAVAGGVPAERLALLDLPASGASLVRYLRARARLEGLVAQENGRSFIRTSGVLLSAEALQGLAAMPTSLPSDVVLPPTLLVMEGSAGEVDKGWLQQLRTAEAPVTLAPFDGYTEFVARDELAAVAPGRVLRRLEDFLASRDAGARCTGSPEPPLPTPTEMALPGLREAAVRFGPGNTLFGILCLPEPARDALAVVLPSIGAAPRSGAGRLWTDLARRLAGKGVASLRFDMAGVGESEGEDCGDRVAATYHPGRVADLRAAVDVLVARGFRRVVVAGHCSGAYTALQAALVERRIAGVLASNPQHFGIQTVLCGKVLRRRPGERVSVRPPKAIAAAGQQDGPNGAGTKPGKRRSLAHRVCPPALRQFLQSLGSEERATRCHLRRLLARGCRVHFVLARQDHGFQRLCRAFGRVPRLPRGIGLDVIADADHNYTSARSHETFIGLMTDAVLRYAQEGSRPLPPARMASTRVGWSPAWRAAAPRFERRPDTG